MNFFDVCDIPSIIVVYDVDQNRFYDYLIQYKYGTPFYWTEWGKGKENSSLLLKGNDKTQF